jgi:hypothetical protein
MDPPYKLEIIEKVFEILSKRDIITDNGVIVLEQKRGNVRAVALYNPSDTVCRFSVPFSSLEFGGNVKVRDLVRHSDKSSFKWRKPR